MVIDVYTRHIVGFGISEYIDGPTVRRMFNQAITGRTPPARISTDHDPLFRFHRWLANLRILEIEEIKSVPYIPTSHPFVERVIGTIRREYLDHSFFWNSIDLHRKLEKFRAYYNGARVHRSLSGITLANRAGDASSAKATWFNMCGYGVATDYSKLLSPLDWEFAPHRYQYLLHDRDSIFAEHLDESVNRLGIEVLKSPPRCPKANAICERIIGTVRRECLDWLIPMSASHLRSILKCWISHYNAGRPHMALGPGVPDPPPGYRDYSIPNSRHRRGGSYADRAESVLGGLHHEYYLAPAVA